MSKRKKNKKRKGFTLIELVAVILILGIIATIAIGTIRNRIDDVRKSAYKTSVQNIIKAGENYISQKLLTTNNLEYPIVFTCNGEECTSGEDRLEFKGEVPVSGTLSIDRDHRVSVSYLSNGKYCTSGIKTDLQVGKTCADIDITKPTLTTELDGKTINLTYNDNVGVTHYCVTTTDNPNTCEWNTITSTHELQEQGIYYVYVRDAKNNISDGTMIEAPVTAFCQYPIGYNFDFAYTGDVQEFEVPCNGLYKLEVWGAQGGGNSSLGSCPGGNGGYSVGYTELIRDDVIYVVAGGVGQTVTGRKAYAAGGYNGGGRGHCYGDSTDSGTGGGGATHIAKVTGTLSSIGYDSFVTQGNGYIVAGGGGGTPQGYSQRGGAGGGTTGGSGTCDYAADRPGGQEAGQSSFGQASNPTSDYNVGGGGGGFYGAYKTGVNGTSGPGGSGWIGGVPEITYKGTVYSPSTSQGANSGNGKAKITLIAY